MEASVFDHLPAADPGDKSLIHFKTVSDESGLEDGNLDITAAIERTEDGIRLFRRHPPNPLTPKG